MFEKIEIFDKRYTELSTRLYDPAVASNADEFQKTCVDYFAMIQQYGADAVAANLKSWLSETSAMGCGDDITVLIAYFSDDATTESEAAANE